MSVTVHPDRRRADVWVLRISLARPAPGARPRGTMMFRGTRREAVREARHIMHDLAMGAPLARDVRLADLFAEWLNALASKRSEKTVRGYRNILTRYVLPEIGELPARAFSEQQVEQFLSSLREASAYRHERTISPRTIRNILETVRSACNWATREGKLAVNPLNRISYEEQKVALIPYGERKRRKLNSVGFEQGKEFTPADR